MGAWEEGPFDNDTAADWVFEFGEANVEAGFDHVRTALMAAAGIAGSDYLQADAGCEAVAAREIIGAIRRVPVERSPYNEAALDQVLADNSELADLWDEADSVTWRTATESRNASLTW